MFILDTRSGQYFGLPPELAGLWLTLFSGGMGGTGSRNPADGEAAANFIRSLRLRHWLVDGADVDGARPRARPAVHSARAMPALDAFYCRVWFGWTLRFRGFHAAYNRAKSYATAGGAETVSAVRSLAFEAAMAAFHRADRFVISRRGLDDCLPRSLALFVHLRRRGLAVRHVIGVTRYPFAAHAWVEHGGDVLLEARRFGVTPNMASPADHGRRTGFVPIAEIG